MGEYFYPVLADDKWELEGFYDPMTFGYWTSDREGRPCLGREGLKIMEHAYMGNPIPETVCDWLAKRPMRVAWVGDYTDKKTVPPQVHRDVVDYVIGGEVENALQKFGWRFRRLPVTQHGSSAGKFLCNCSKCLAMRIPAMKEEGESNVFHPLPFMTTTDGAPGYRFGEAFCPGIEDRIGSWAWDLLAVTQGVPIGFDLLEFDFGSL